MSSLSPHFALEEFLVSETAARRDIDMTAPPVVVEQLERLARLVLEPLRAALRRPIIITSGYRPAALNAYVGGSAHSDHLYGRAADIICPALPLKEFAGLVIFECSPLPVRQCIVEFGRWVHVSVEVDGSKPKHEYLVASRDGGKTVYKPWESAA